MKNKEPFRHLKLELIAFAEDFVFPFDSGLFYVKHGIHKAEVNLNEYDL